MVNLIEDHFDSFTTQRTGRTKSIRSFTWNNENNISVQVITYGATITSLKIPDKNGILEDIVTGFSNLAGYQSEDNPYFGATVGRVANRIAFGQIPCLGSVFQVSKNWRQHQLHGGFLGFDKVLWEHYVDGKRLILSYHSEDLEEGYPGDLVVHAIFELTSCNQFLVEFKATTTKPTYVNLTNHSYFNLAGHGAGPEELYNHVVVINADRITDVNEDSIPTGRLSDVAETVFDLRVAKILGDTINKVPDSLGYDHNFCINKGEKQGDAFIARVYHPGSGRGLEVYSDQPGVQFYTANYFPENPENCKGNKDDLKTLSGKDGVKYYKHGAFCLETQNWPDAPNHQHFPKSLLFPGEMYLHTVTYKFFIKK